MDKIELLQHLSESSHKEFVEAIQGIDEPTSWGQVVSAGNEDEFLHTDGSIYSITLHVASCKMMYGSVAFRNLDVRWRDCAEHIQRIEPDWISATEYLEEAHDYWMNSWNHLHDEDLESMANHFSGAIWPAWKIIQAMNHHDSYHAGQIAMLRYTVQPTHDYPPSVADDIRTHCANLPSW